VLASLWTGSGPPALDGNLLNYIAAPNRYGLPARAATHQAGGATSAGHPPVNRSSHSILAKYISSWQYRSMAIYSNPDSLSTTFAALADPTRRAILARLASGEADVSELMKPFKLSQPTISKHLKVLEDAGLVARGRASQRRPRTLLVAPLENLDAWLEPYRRFWEGKFANLDNYLTHLRETKKTHSREKTDGRRKR
jgi:DNA-binding transcriptional ArsR family regulator